MKYRRDSRLCRQRFVSGDFNHVEFVFDTITHVQHGGYRNGNVTNVTSESKQQQHFGPRRSLCLLNPFTSTHKAGVEVCLLLMARLHCSPFRPHGGHNEALLLPGHENRALRCLWSTPITR